MTKEELNFIRHVDDSVNTKIRQLEMLKSKRFLLSSFDYSKSKVQTSNQGNHSEELINKIIDFEAEINRDVDTLIDLKMKARVEIDQVGGVYGVILQMRYLENRNWVEISRALNYSPKHIFKLHGKALQMILKVDTK